MLVDLMHELLNFKNAILSKHSLITKPTLDIHIMHTCIIIVFKTTFVMNQHFPVLRHSQNLFIKVMRIAFITRHNTKLFLCNITKVLICYHRTATQSLHLNILLLSHFFRCETVTSRLYVLENQCFKQNILFLSTYILICRSGYTQDLYLVY